MDANRATADDDLTLEELSEWIWRWRNHYRMLDQLRTGTNTEATLLDAWKSKIDECFREKIRARL